MAAAQDRDAEREAILAALAPVVDGIAATFGPVCEVVLHDYRRPEASVVAVGLRDRADGKRGDERDRHADARPR